MAPAIRAKINLRNSQIWQMEEYLVTERDFLNKLLFKIIAHYRADLKDEFLPNH